MKSATATDHLDSALRRLRQARVTEACGRVVQVIGLVVESEGPVADAGDRPLGLDDKPDDLNDAAAGLGDARLAQAPESGIEVVGCGGGFHEARDCRSCSILVSRRASSRPKRV